MKDNVMTIRALLLIASVFVFFNNSEAKGDGALTTDALLVGDKSVVLNDEKVGCAVSIGKDLQYQTCAGGLFPLRSSGQAGRIVEGALGFSIGGVRVPPAFTNFVIIIEFGAFETVPLYILSPQANTVRGCGFTHGKLALQSKIVGSGAVGMGYLLVELSSRMQFNQDFKKMPAVAVSLNTVLDGPLAPLFVGDLTTAQFGVPQIFMLANMQGYAADVTTDGFTLTVLIYFHVFGATDDSVIILPSTLLGLNESIEKIINSSQVSFKAVGE